MLSSASGARPRLVWTSMPVALMTGVIRDARSRSRFERRLEMIASAPGMVFSDRSPCRCRRTAWTTTGGGRPGSPSTCRMLSTEGIARSRDAFMIAGLHEVARVQRRERCRLAIRKSEAHQTLPAALVHVVHQLHHAPGAQSQRVMLQGAGRQQQQRVKHLVVEAGRVPQRVVTTTDRVGQTRPEFGLAGEMLAQMREAERHVPRFILRGEPGDGGRDRIGSVTLDKPEK